MLRRLLAYDFRSMWKQFSLLWPAVLLVALVNRLLMALTRSAEIPEAAETVMNRMGFLFGVIPVLVYFALIVAMSVISLIYVLQRFYHGLLGSEGYLMHTLPVKTWQLIASKLITAVVVTVCSGVVGVLSILILAADREFFADLGEMLPRMTDVDVVLVVIQLLLVSIITTAATYTQIYAACSLGQLSNKNRLLVSVVAYVAINIVLSTLTSGLMMTIGLLEANGGVLSDLIEGVAGAVHSGRLHVTGAVNLALLFANVLTLLKGALFFFLSEYLLRKKLNLQ